jgi:glutamyl-Q tRNA(Asp) synthetase
VRVPDETLVFVDRWVGEYRQHLGNEVGDFVVARADGYWAYQLAVVVDDYLQGITHVVRGADLLDSTPRQLFLQRSLGYPQPHYLHVPVVCNEAGEKLSKQTGADAVADNEPINVLSAAMTFLGWTPPASAQANLTSFWCWAVEAWIAGRNGERGSGQLHWAAHQAAQRDA